MSVFVPPSVAVAMPSRGTVHSRTMEATLAALQVAEQAGAVRRVPEWMAFAHGLPIPTSHERAAQRAMDTGADYIWFIEEDNVPPPTALLKSLDRMGRTDAWYVAVNYPVGEPPPKGSGTRWSSVYRESGEIQFTGLGITLMRREVFEKLPQPWFTLDQRMHRARRDAPLSLIDIPYGDGEGGVDVTFGLRLRELGIHLEEVPGMVGGHLRVKKHGRLSWNTSPHEVELWNTIDAQQRIFSTAESDRFLPDPSWDKRFAELGPWVSGFDIAGRHYGGSFDPVNDQRVVMCRDRFPEAKVILELGSLEGGHTVALSRWADEVVGVEGRERNIEKARWILYLHGAENARIEQANLETVDLAAEFGHFSLVFSVGVLYHMPDPIRLLDQMASAAPRLFMWTHYSPTDADLTYQEFGVEDPLSGLSDTSTWLPRERLLDELRKRYTRVEILGEDDRGADKPAITIAAERT